MLNTKLPHNHNCSKETEKLYSKLAEYNDFQTIAEIFSLLGDTSRIRIFWLLCHTEECVINISTLVDMTSPAVAHHLRKLKEKELITSKRVGKEVYYRASDTSEAKLIHNVIEKVMEISCPKGTTAKETANTDIVKSIHSYLIENLEKRITIEDLSKKFLMNTTTLKSVFKEVYGTSVASHIKEHRMERARALLKETDTPVLEIAKLVGYDNPSKFSSAFKEVFGLLPTEYRKKGDKIHIREHNCEL